MINIGDKVRVNHNKEVYDDFFDETGIVTKEFITVTGVRKLIVRFDTPVEIYEHANNYFPEEWHVFECYDFVEDCLDLMEK